MEFRIDHTLALLERTPLTLAALLGGLPDAWTLANEGPETFTPYDVVGHLIHGERTDWMVRARIILEHPWQVFLGVLHCHGHSEP